tara:strand:- start:22822 stop:23700 length:879 start_codon:yes stop_codon:yes gene_type:complete
MKEVVKMKDTEQLDIQHLQSWIGRSETDYDTVTRTLARAFHATVLDRDENPSKGDVVPQNLHWCLAPRTVSMSKLGPDGHPARGDFLPPIPLPRRMWAGSRLRFLDQLRVGDDVVRNSTIKDVTVKEGRSGVLCFVVVRHVYSTARGDAIEEEQDIVYREAQTQAAVPPPIPETEPGTFHKNIQVTPPLLFRYSALTFNGHRIHYDRPYATGEEHYEGLVVHGPLQASFLLALADTMRPDQRCNAFSFRGLRPLFDQGSCAINGEWVEENNKAKLWTGPSKAFANMEASATW